MKQVKCTRVRTFDNLLEAQAEANKTGASYHEARFVCFCKECGKFYISDKRPQPEKV